jgi:lysosomal acid lipase/cholesteryl ester hydrolase
MFKELPRHTAAKEIPHFEHLDFLWAQDVDQLVFPHVFDALACYSNAQALAGASEDESTRHMELKFLNNIGKEHQRGGSSNLLWSGSDDEKSSSDYDGSGEPATPVTRARAQYKLQIQDQSATMVFPRRPLGVAPSVSPITPDGGTNSHPAKAAESSDVANESPSQPINRASSLGSMSESGLTPKFSPKGISLGTSRPSVSGLSRPEDASGSGDERTGFSTGNRTSQWATN